MNTHSIVKLFIAIFLYGITTTSQAVEPEQIYPYSIEGARFEIITPASRENEGLIRVFSDSDCSYCSEEFVISVNTIITLANTGMQMSAIELGDHAHKIASLHISKPGRVRALSFSN